MCWDNRLRESGGAGCSQTYGKDPFASACVWTHISPLCLCCPWLRNLLFSFSSSLFDFLELVIPGPGLSKRLRAIKYSSALINCSPSPFGGGRGGEKMTLNYSGPNQGYFWQLPRFRWGGAQQAPVFVCFDVVAPLTPCPSSAVIITGIMQGSSNAYFSPDCSFPSSRHGSKTSIDQLNHYIMLCKEIPPLSCTDKKCECPYRRNMHKLRLSYTPSLMSIPFRPNIRPEWSWSNHAWSSEMSDFI